MESRKSMFQLASLAVGLFAFLDSISTITSSDVEVVRARLVGGHTNSTGRVEVSRNGSVWGTVCDWNWTDKEATVVCRQLGYKWGEAFNWAAFGEGDGEGDGEMFLNNVRCTGTEKNIDECLHWVWGEHRCGPNETAGVACYNKPVEVVRARLVGGQTNTTGRVEVSRNGSVWGTVCYDRWTDREAHVVCRQLGYKWGELLRWDAFGKNWDAFGGDGAMFLYAVQCNGTEENIDQCQHPGWGKVHCQTTKVGASVTCFSKPVRLSRGDNSHGVVEIMEDKWSVLCGEGFGNKLAQIVCFELGFQNGIALAMGSFNDIPTTYVRSNITCVGNESSILNCTYDKFRACQEDKFLNYAVVSCLNGSLSKEPKLKLEGSEETDMANQMGRVLIKRYGIWGRVCPDFWNDKDADVVCRHLGFTGGVAYTYTFSGYGLYTLGIVGCHGNESTLFDCPVSPVRCDGQVSFGDAGVLCYTVKKPALRMVGSGNTGHLEIIFDSFTGAICDIDLRVAMVACKQLGFLDGEPRSSLLSSIGATAVISSTDCGGSEFSIFMCRNSGWQKNINETCNDAHRIAGVVCYTNVRISDGQEDENTTEGKVKMYHHGGWVTVCADGFHDSDARLVCRELGFPYSKALEPGSFGREYYSDFVTDFNCTGSELSIALCPFNASGECVDKSSNYASVICSKFPIGNNEMYILPFDSFPATVVVKKHGMNGTICAEGWDHKDAGVLCRQLGYSGGGLSFEPQYSGSNTPIWMTNVDCHGNETRIQYCRFLETSTRGCLSNQMAARVYCFEGPGISGIQVRLVNGSEPSNGRVEILYGGTWGTYCVSKYRGWNSGARVVCQQLGFTDGQPTNSFYGAGTGEILRNIFLEILS
ncbi:scavenger receptor cysteine-rich domain superfamily protein-like [Dreissena polymorpha]|uniref:scavenger receptor cysteine-rich domain superfamily protein-like n=1 Tax=Dreissena polymorpha TaxID=45954 RepID=UPI002263F404|nr:scavenger receptor cysteine-rich domain superfamily protein-like [Dreissena polymorpha]